MTLMGAKMFHRVIRRFRRYREDRDLRRASHQQHMSVGGRAGDRFRRERTDCSWAVLDHELLPKRVAERLRDKTRNAVAIAARREGNEDLDRLLRPNLRACGLTQTHHGKHGQCRHKHASRVHDRVERFCQCQVR
jgi:hypothetical protein